MNTFLIYIVLIFWAVTTIYPIFWQIQSSLYDGSLLSKKRNFVGFQNFANLFANPDFGQTVGNTIFYSVGVVIITIVLSTLAAVWLNGEAQKRLNGLTLAAIFTPHRSMTSVLWERCGARRSISFNVAPG